MRFSVRVLFYLFSIVFLMAFSAVSPANARAQTTAALAGIITDPRGAAIAGAQISVEQIPSAGEPERAVSGR